MRCEKVRGSCDHLESLPKSSSFPRTWESRLSTSGSAESLGSRTSVQGKFLLLELNAQSLGWFKTFKVQTQEKPKYNHVIPNARPIAGDLEPRFSLKRRNLLKESGVPARASQGLRLAGMTKFGDWSQQKNFPRTLLRGRGNDGTLEFS